MPFRVRTTQYRPYKRHEKDKYCMVIKSLSVNIIIDIEYSHCLLFLWSVHNQSIYLSVCFLSQNFGEDKCMKVGRKVGLHKMNTVHRIHTCNIQYITVDLEIIAGT